jgi:serine beta-lactamase-like protein LACTB, mitochondrial
VRGHALVEEAPVMTIVRCAVVVLGSLLAVPAAAQEPLAGLWEGKFGARQPPIALAIDFDSRLVSVNGTTAVPLTIALAGDPVAVQFSFTIAGQTVTFTGRRDGPAIVGTLAGGPLSLTRAAADAPRPAGRKRYPLPAVTSADGLAVAKARALVAELLRKHELPGLSVAVARRGTVLWSEGFGMADVEHGVPVTPLTRFRAGSVSKVLTAAGVALLVEDGKLDLDAPVQRYVPGFPVKPWPITTRQLAAHTAGIRHYRDTEFTGPLKGAPHFSSVLDGLELFKNDPLLFEPGKGYSYSSYGWSLLSAVLEGASGQEFLSYMRNRVFEPLGLHSLGPDHVDAVIPNRSRFYAREAPGRPLEHAPHVDQSYVWAAGGFLATAEDLVRFGSVHLSPGVFTPATLELLFRGQTVIPPGNQTAVGIGWRIGKDSTGRRVLHHAGASQGGRAMLLIYPEPGIVVAMLSNILAPFGEQDAQRIGSLFITP